MSNLGRGRGFKGRHQQPEPRPGDQRELDAPRTLAELTPKSPGFGRGYKELCQQQELQPADELVLNVPRTTSELILSSTDPLETKPIEEAKESRCSTDEEDKLDMKCHVTGIEDEAELKELLTIDDQYIPLLDLLELFSPGEDGIKFNLKLRNFEIAVKNTCPDQVRLHQAFSTFRSAALLSAVTARKLAAVGAAFTRQQGLKNFRRALLSVVLKKTFSKLHLLQRTNPTFLINAANLIGDYFAEAQLSDGNIVHILANPLLQYLKALLACDDVRAHSSLATQLMQNGRVLLSVLEQDLNDLSVSIRRRLITPPPAPSTWLLLASDVCLYQFLPLPNKMQRFYAKNLEFPFGDKNTDVDFAPWRKKSEEREENSSLNPNARTFCSISSHLSRTIPDIN